MFHLRKKAMKWSRGFTMLELLFVLAVIIVLGVVVVLNLVSSNRKARNAKRLSDMNQIASAIQLYRYEHGGNPPGEDGVEYINGKPDWIPGLAPQYMRVVPSDPVDQTGYKYHYVRNGVNYEVSAFMEAHGNDSSCGDGGPGGCDYYENASGQFLTIYNPGASGWNFTSPVLTVLAPNGGANWIRGFKGQVFWSTSSTNPVVINLLKNGSFYKTLSASAPAVRFSGYNFQNLYPNAYYALVSIPADVALGSDYKIEVLDSSDQSISGISSASFSVIPFYSNVTVRGRLVDSFTLEPMTGVQLVNSSTSVSTNSSGEFSMFAFTDDLPENTSKPLFSTWPTCHLAQGSAFFNYYTAIYASFNPFDLNRNGTNHPIYSSYVDLGDIKLWPAVGLTINSDIPVQYKIEYPEEGASAGNSSFKTMHNGSNELPLDYDAQVKLTDQSGNIYISPAIRLPANWGCAAKTLNFSGGQFMWQ